MIDTKRIILLGSLPAMLFITFVGESVSQAAPPWEQVEKLVATDGVAGDVFGTSVAISGNLAVVGAPLDSDNGTNSGTAYVFDVSTGEQLFKLHASDGAEGDIFGGSIAVSRNLAVISAHDDSDNGVDSGSAYVFDVSTGEQLFKLLAADGEAYDLFGGCVAVSGNLAVIGADGDNDHGTGSGSAYVFDISTGKQLFKLLADDGSDNDYFGSSVSVSGNLAVIGAYGDSISGVRSGSAYVFDVTTGRQIFKLLANDLEEGDTFGISVAISGNLAIIGASGDGDNGRNSGSAYVFDVTTGKQLYKLLASDGEASDAFGISVAMDGNQAVIGAYFDYDNGPASGSAYVFDVTTGKQLFKLLATDGTIKDRLGTVVALSGNTVIVGAFSDDDNGSNSGSAYVFQPRITDYLSVEPMPLVGGEDGGFSFVGGVPDTMSWLLYSVDGLGRTFIKPLNVTVDLASPKIAFGPGLTDGDGNREIVRMLPGVTEAVDVWFQVVQRENVTNFFRTKIVP